MRFIRPLGLFAFVLALVAVALLPTAEAKSSVAMEMAMDEKWSKPQEVVFFPATFTAAAPVKLSFTVLSASDGLKAPIPNPVTFDYAGEQHDVPFSIMTPFHNGYVRESGQVVYRATPSDGSAPLEFTVTVHTKGFYAPGPALVPLLATLALVALVVARKLR